MENEIIEESIPSSERKRKLATIQKIKKLIPIENADKIELAVFESIGWKVVVQKGLYNVGDLVCYFEIDSVLPYKYFPELENVKYRIKTIKLRGQISQGYCVPMETIMEHWPIESLIFEGLDLTNLIGVTKYVKPQNNSGQGGVIVGRTIGNFPSHLVAKTDEERIQSALRFLNQMAGRSYEITVKCDGSSMTVGVDNGEFFVASRNLKKDPDGESTFAKVAQKYGLKEAFEAEFEIDSEYPNELPMFILQGEVCGPKIQGGKLGIQEDDFYVFNIFDQVTKKMISPYSDAGMNILDSLGLKAVPLVESGESFNYTLDELLELAKGKYDGTNNHREGIVIRSYGNFENYFGDYLSFKCINNDFLLKGGE